MYEPRSTFNLEQKDYNGISLNELRTLAENQIRLEKIDYPVYTRQKVYKKYFRKSLKETKRQKNTTRK